MNKTYFIKKEYKHRKINKTLDTNRDENYWSNGRHYAAFYYQYYVYKYVRDLMMKKKLNSVVDIGCGVATKLMEIVSPLAKEVCGIDQKDAVLYCRRKYKNSNAKFLEDNFEKPNLKNYPKFDIVICCDVIEHLEDPDILLNYIKKFASKDTIIIISTPERDVMRGVDNNMSPQEDHVREWNSKEFKKYVSSSGFKVLNHRKMKCLKFTLRYPFIVEYISKFLRKTLKSNQLIVCKIN